MHVYRIIVLCLCIIIAACLYKNSKTHRTLIVEGVTIPPPPPEVFAPNRYYIKQYFDIYMNSAAGELQKTIISDDAASGSLKAGTNFVRVVKDFLWFNTPYTSTSSIVIPKSSDTLYAWFKDPNGSVYPYLLANANKTASHMLKNLFKVRPNKIPKYFH